MLSFRPGSPSQPSHPLPRTKGYLLLGVAALAILLYQFVRTASSYVMSGDLRDFLQGYSAGQRVLANGWENLYDLPAQIAFQAQYVARTGVATTLDALPFVSLPPTALLFVPVGMLPPSLAAGVWLAVNLTLATLSIAMVARAVSTPGALGLGLTHESPSPAWVIAAGVIAVLTYMPLVWGLLIGQSVGFTLFLFSLAYLALARGNNRLGGVSLALLAMIKPQLVVGPAVFLVAQRRWSALATFIGSGLLLGAFSLMLVGVSAIGSYLHLLGQMDSFFGDSRLGLYTPLMVNWRSWVARIPGIDATSGITLTMALTIVTFVVTIYAWRRRASGGRMFARAYLCFAAAGLICSFHSTYQDLIILLPVGIAAVALDRDAFALSLLRVRSLSLWERVGVRAGMRTSSPHTAPAPIPQPRLKPWPDLAIAAGVLILIIPSLAWFVVGPHAMARGYIWATMGAPALVLIMLATLPTPTPQSPTPAAGPGAKGILP